MVILEQQDTNTNLSYHKVMAWLSPSYPIGSFAYSHGLEFEIASGNITEKQEVKQWVEDLLKFGSGWNELVLFSLAYKSDINSLDELSNFAKALAQSKERYEETLALGRAFAKVTSKLVMVTGQEMPLPIVMGMCAKNEDISLEYILPLFAHNFVANLISVAVRLAPLGQTAGQQVLFELFATIEEVANKALVASIADLGTSCILADIASMKHEILKTRIFRS